MWLSEGTSPGPFFFWSLVTAFPALIIVLLAVSLTDGTRRVVLAAVLTFATTLTWGLLTIPSLYRPTSATYASCGTPLRSIGWSVGNVDCDVRRLVTGGVVLLVALVLAPVAAMVARWSNRFGYRTDWSPSGWLRGWRV